MNIPLQQQFLALLRSGLWGIPVDAALFRGRTDWEAIFAHAVRQTVPGLVVEGVNTLPAVLRPPASLLDKMRARLTSDIRTHALLNRTLVEMVTFLRRHGIHPVLLKGQGVALNYIEPTRRQCGDIDLYVGKEDYDHAVWLVRRRYGTDKQATESRKHYHFTHQGVVVELHRIAEQLPLPWHDRQFQRWTTDHLYGYHLRTVEIEGTTIDLPPVDFDALYIFNHAWHHFAAGGGIGLRQLCDWARYLHTFRNEIDHAALRRHLKAFGLWRAWRVFGCIVVDTLGLPAADFPFYTSAYAKHGGRMLEMIGWEGNFGFFDSLRTRHPDGYVGGKMHTLKWMHRRLGDLLPVFAPQVVAVYGRSIYNGVRQVMIDKLTYLNI